MTHLRFDGYRFLNKGIYQGGGTYVGTGYTCSKSSNKDSDQFVSIYFVAGSGYYYS
jgi:hypothetical protein